MNAPCMGCEEREIGCHAVCPAYNDYKRFREAVRKDQYNDSLADQFTMSKERGIKRKLMDKKSGRVHEK